MMTISANGVLVTKADKKMAGEDLPPKMFIGRAGANEAITRVLVGDLNICHPLWQCVTEPQRIERLAKNQMGWADDFWYFLQSALDVPAIDTRI